MNRRTLLNLATSAPLLQAAAFAHAARREPRAIAFAAFAVFDPRPLVTRVEELFPGRGMEFTAFGARGSSSTRGCGR